MNKPTKRRVRGADPQLQLSEMSEDIRQIQAPDGPSPEELIHSMVQRSTTYQTLNNSFTQHFPGHKLEPWLKADREIRSKHVQGLGKFLFYSSPGKMDFHEHLLKIVLATLKRKRRPHKKGNKRRGADFFLFEDGKKIYCELETGLLHRSERRPNLEARIRRYPDRCIILVCNQVDKKRYQHSNLRFQANREPIIMTIWEFLQHEEHFFEK